MKYVSSIRCLMKDVKKDKPHAKTWQELAKIWTHYIVIFLLIFGGFMWILDRFVKPNVTYNIENYYQK